MTIPKVKRAWCCECRSSCCLAEAKNQFPLCSNEADSSITSGRFVPEAYYRKLMRVVNVATKLSIKMKPLPNPFMDLEKALAGALADIKKG